MSENHLSFEEKESRNSFFIAILFKDSAERFSGDRSQNVSSLMDPEIAGGVLPVRG
jgi:hypothetical protein